MAVLSRITCKRCGVTTEVSHSPVDAPPEICGTCRKADMASARDQHFAKLDALSIEDRLRRVEEWIYDYRPQWVAPPRF
jgi:hypothetical protein